MSAPNLALVAVVHGRACVLYMDADEGITEHIAAVGEVVALEECGQWPPSVEGNKVLVCTLALVDDGPSDWPGARECRLDATGHRQPTPEEWGRHLDEEHLWRTAEQVATEPVAASSVEDVLGFKIRPTPTITEDTKITVFHGPPVPADPPRE